MIIGIESSCDESAIAVFDEHNGVVFDEVSSQIKLHAQYGGVVPELASREHIKNFPLLLDHLKQSGLSPFSSIAVTREPGLPGCVQVGLAIARALSLQLQLPLDEINHLHGHLFSPFIPIHEHAPESFSSVFLTKLPHLTLLVSGGNTIVYEITSSLALRPLAGTVDDAAGEAFDKGAKLLGMPYPGGHLIEQHARSGNAQLYHFPRAFPQKADMKFSFSGLKTSLRYFLEKFHGQWSDHLDDICAAYQEAIISSLVHKFKQILSDRPYIKSVGLCGGVSNNLALRAAFGTLAEHHHTELLLPHRKHTGDNAAMIAFTGYIHQLFPSSFATTDSH